MKAPVVIGKSIGPDLSWGKTHYRRNFVNARLSVCGLFDDRLDGDGIVETATKQLPSCKSCRRRAFANPDFVMVREVAL